jgi:hypothetical protein
VKTTRKQISKLMRPNTLVFFFQPIPAVKFSREMEEEGNCTWSVCAGSCQPCFLAMAPFAFLSPLLLPSASLSSSSPVSLWHHRTREGSPLPCFLGSRVAQESIKTPRSGRTLSPLSFLLLFWWLFFFFDCAGLRCHFRAG